MAVYHNSPNGPRLCKAEKVQCPYGKAGQPHFENQADAQIAYERQMAHNFGHFIAAKKSPQEKVLQAAYQKREKLEAAVNLRKDRLHRKVRLIKASPAVRATVATARFAHNAPAKTMGAYSRAKTVAAPNARKFKDTVLKELARQGQLNEQAYNDYKTQRLAHRAAKGAHRAAPVTPVAKHRGNRQLVGTIAALTPMAAGPGFTDFGFISTSHKSNARAKHRRSNPRLAALGQRIEALGNNLEYNTRSMARG